MTRNILHTPMIEIISQINAFIIRYEYQTIQDFEKFHNEIAVLVNPYLKDFGLEYTQWTIRTVKNTDDNFVDKNNFHLILNNIDVLKLQLPNANFTTDKGKSEAILRKIYFDLPNEKLDNRINLNSYLKYLISNKLYIDIVNYETNIQQLTDEISKSVDLSKDKLFELSNIKKEFTFVVPKSDN